MPFTLEYNTNRNYISNSRFRISKLKFFLFRLYLLTDSVLSQVWLELDLWNLSVLIPIHLLKDDLKKQTILCIESIIWWQYLIVASRWYNEQHWYNDTYLKLFFCKRGFQCFHFEIYDPVYECVCYLVVLH